VFSLVSRLKENDLGVFLDEKKNDNYAKHGSHA